MIILNCSMPKSGSTLAYIYTSGLLDYFFPSTAQLHFERAVSEGKLKGVGSFLNCFSSSEYDLINSIRSEHSGPIHIKIHLGADQVIQSLHYAIGAGVNIQDLKKHLDSSKIYIISTFRDPRDVLLSAMDHRKRTILNSVPELAECCDIQSSVEFVKWACEIASSWKECNLALLLSYDDLVAKPEKVLQQINNHLKLEANAQQIADIIACEIQKRKPNTNQYNIGKINRYMEIMTDEQIQFCNSEFSEYLEIFGYKM